MERLHQEHMHRGKEACTRNGGYRDGANHGSEKLSVKVYDTKESFRECELGMPHVGDAQ